MRCKIFGNCTCGSDPWRGWNAAECKCALETLLAGVSTKRATKQHRHLNRSKTQKIHRNSLINFPLHGFNKHIPWFRCSGKRKHLNLASRQNPAVNPLTANALQDFQRLCPWFRSQAGLECSGMQTCSGGTSGRGFHQTRNRVTNASEPEQSPRNSLQFIETLPIARIHQASPLVQMQRRRGASEPCRKAESGSQTAHNKHIARLSATVPMVQIPTGLGTPQNANTPWRCFWQGYPPTRNRTAHASEPRQNPKNSPQYIEKLSITRIQQVHSRVQMQWKSGASEPEQNPRKPPQHLDKLSVARFQQASPPVQMQRKKGASEPRIKAESGSQTAHNKHIAGLSATAPVVQIPTGFGTPQNANAP